MGYNLYITRAPSSLDYAEHPIPEEEWKAIVETDPSLRISHEDYFERRTDDGRVERINLVIWEDHPDRVPFWFEDGAIQAKNPDEKTVEKMVELARRLNARVLGEEDEEYLGGGKTVEQEVDVAVHAERQKKSPTLVKALALLAVVALLPEALSRLLGNGQLSAPGVGQNGISKIALVAEMLSLIFAWLGLLSAVCISVFSVVPRKAKMVMWIWIILSLAIVVFLNPFLRF